MTRAIDEILIGDALTWSLLTTEQLRHEHEALRQALLTARKQIALWAPLVAWRHRCDVCGARKPDEPVAPSEPTEQEIRRIANYLTQVRHLGRAVCGECPDVAVFPDVRMDEARAAWHLGARHDGRGEIHGPTVALTEIGPKGPWPRSRDDETNNSPGVPAVEG